MNVREAMVEISGRVPGAVRVLCDLQQKDPERLPHMLRAFKEHNLTDGRLWVAFKDVCGCDYSELMRRALDEPHVLARDVAAFESGVHV